MISSKRQEHSTAQRCCKRSRAATAVRRRLIRTCYIAEKYPQVPWLKGENQPNEGILTTLMPRGQRMLFFASETSCQCHCQLKLHVACPNRNKTLQHQHVVQHSMDSKEYRELRMNRLKSHRYEQPLAGDFFLAVQHHPSVGSMSSCQTQLLKCQRFKP